MRTALLVLVTALIGCKTPGKPSEGPGQQVSGRPVETQPPQAPHQKPAFAGQTRAPYMTANVRFQTDVVASGLEHPWAVVAFLGTDEMLVTEKPGRMQIVNARGEKSPVTGLPKVDARDQGGMLDVITDPEFSENRTIYFCYSEPRDGDTNGTAIARAELVRDGVSGRLENTKVIFRMKPDFESNMHFGCRLLLRDGFLFAGLGERSHMGGRMQAQKLDSHFGKVIRIRPDGSVPDDNPFVGQAGARPEIWSIGHRNIQAAAFHPQTGELWEVEHGARGGDEINVVERGKDYGWPTIAYGIEYKGGNIGEGKTQAPGMEQPIYYWDPVIAPSGMMFYTGDLFPAWKGSLFVGGLAGKHIARLTLDGRRVVGEERLLADRGARIRDVRQGPHGAIYVLTDDANGELLKLVPAERPDQSAAR